MSNVGFRGGSSLFDLGSSQAMAAFFELIRSHPQLLANAGCELVTDRLYRRYVRRVDVASTRKILEKVKDVFSGTSSSALLSMLNQVEAMQGGLDLGADNLAKVFSRYFDAIEHCMESAEVNFQEFASDPASSYCYEPVRVVRSQMPAYMMDKRIPLAAYDDLDGRPFWLQ